MTDALYLTRSLFEPPLGVTATLIKILPSRIYFKKFSVFYGTEGSFP
jgi:hypothetical protein